MTCPKCSSSAVEEHGTNPGDCHWWLCRTCGNVIEEKKAKRKGEDDVARP